MTISNDHRPARLGTAKAASYYRCRLPAEYTLANRVGRMLNICLREDAILGRVDRWLAREFAPRGTGAPRHDHAV